MSKDDYQVSCTTFRVCNIHGFYKKVHTSNTVDSRNDFGFFVTFSRIIIKYHALSFESEQLSRSVLGNSSMAIQKKLCRKKHNKKIEK